MSRRAKGTPFRLKSYSAIKQGGLKYMGSSPMREEDPPPPTEYEVPQHLKRQEGRRAGESDWKYTQRMKQLEWKKGYHKEKFEKEAAEGEGAAEVEESASEEVSDWITISGDPWKYKKTSTGYKTLDTSAKNPKEIDVPTGSKMFTIIEDYLTKN